MSIAHVSPFAVDVFGRCHNNFLNVIVNIGVILQYLEENGCSHSIYREILAGLPEVLPVSTVPAR